MRLYRERLEILRNSLIRLSRSLQGKAEAVVRARVVGTERQRFVPLRDGGRILALVRQRNRHIELLVEVHRRRSDVLDALRRRRIDKLRDIHGAIGHRRVLDQDGGRVVAVRINMRQEHLRIRRAAFGGKDQPAAVG